MDEGSSRAGSFHLSPPTRRTVARGDSHTSFSEVSSTLRSCFARAWTVMSAFFQVKTVSKCTTVTGFSDSWNKHVASIAYHFQFTRPGRSFVRRLINTCETMFCVARTSLPARPIWATTLPGCDEDYSFPERVCL